MMIRAAVTFLVCCFALSGALSPAAAQMAIPDAVAAKGETAVLTVHAAGAQVYDCKASADGKLTWLFREPIATLMENGKTVGRHYAGPTWEHVDGSRVTGRLLAHANGETPKDIPWLKLEVSAASGAGLLSAVTAIQRINTQGGQFGGPCDKAGVTVAAPYTADYVFLKKQ